MGVLRDDHESDVGLILSICEEACEDWNIRFSGKEGVVLGVKREGVEAICRVGGRILALCFPAKPSAFKRVSALLIMMCLHPWLIVRRVGSEGVYDQIVFGDSIRDFAVDFMVDTVPIVLSTLESYVGTEWVALTNWQGFISQEFKNEFVVFLRWLGNSDLLTYSLGSPIYNDDRLARIILGTSLILESTYGPIKWGQN